MLNPFAARGPDAQTVQVLGGVRSVRADFSPGFAQYPERRPFAAIDGDPTTAWIADRSLALPRHHVDVAFTRPRAVDHVDLLPYGDSRGVVNRVAVNGREFAVHPGWNRLHARPAPRHRHLGADREGHAGQDGGGRRGRRQRAAHPRACTPTEALRPPVLVERALAGRPTRPRLADLPLRPHDGRRPGAAARGHRRPPARPRARPAGRRARLDADDRAPGAALLPRRRPGERRARDARPRARRLGGRPGGRRRSTGPRASRGSGATGRRSAFDGDPRRAWIAGWVRAHGRVASVDRRRRPRTIRSLRLVRPRGARALPDARARRRRRRRAAAGRRRRRRDDPARPAAAGADGAHRGPRRGVPARARRRSPASAGRSASGRSRATASRRPPRGGAGRWTSRARRVRGSPLGATTVRMRVAGSREELDAGRPLRAVACGAPVALPAGRTTVRAPAAPWRLDHVRLRLARAPPGAARRADRPRGRARARGARDAHGDPPGGARARRGSCSASPTTAAGGRRATAATSARPCRCRATRTAGRCRRVHPRGVPLRAQSRARRRRRDLADRLPGAAGAAARAPPAADGDAARRPPRRPRAAAVGAARAAGRRRRRARARVRVRAARRASCSARSSALALYRGVGARALALAGGALLLLVVPVAHLLGGLPGRGYDTNYAVAHIAAHWAGVAAVCALGMALVLTLRPARARGPRSRPAP